MSSHSSKPNVVPVNVYVRVRPFMEKEEHSNVIQVLNCKDIVLVHNNNKKKYSFDGVFGTDSKQISIYQTIAKPLTSEVLSGYNCTVFAYGQTGSGKTFTMTEGISSYSSNKLHRNVFLSSPNAANDYVLVEKSGLIPRFLTELFQELHKLDQQYTVQCSYLEIYNEDLRDLLSLSDDPSRIRIYDDSRNKGTVMVHQIEEITIHNTVDGLKLLQRGHEKRHTSATLMNDKSSRSHAIFTITVHTREKVQDGEEVIRMGKINLVDLAGSENINRSGASDRQAREAGNINQSLLTLGRVIKALSEKNSYIPFRQSKLTRILQDSLGGKTKTSIIATISPSLSNLEETLSTLDYASRARGITNKPETNERISEKQLIKQYLDKIKHLQRDLDAARTGEGICLDSDNYEKLITQQKTQENELSEKSKLIGELEKQLKAVEEEKQMQEQRWIETCISFEHSRLEVEKIKRMYEKTELERKEQEYLAEKYRKSAELLHLEANGLLDMIKRSSYNEEVLCQKVMNLHGIAMANNELFKSSCARIVDACSEIQTNAMDFNSYSEEFNQKVMEQMESIQQLCLKNETELKSLKSMIISENVFDKLLEINKMNLMDFQETITNRYKEYVDMIFASQEESNKNLHALQNVMLQNEERRRHDFAKLGEILKGLENLLSPKVFIKKLEKAQDHFNQEYDVIWERQDRLEYCMDAASLEIKKSENKILDFAATQFDKCQSRQVLIKKENVNCLCFIEELQSNISTDYWNIKDNFKECINNFIHKIANSKYLMLRRVKDSFGNMIKDLANDNTNFVKQVKNTYVQIQKVFDNECNAIRESVRESSSELLLVLSKMRDCSEEIYTQVIQYPEHTKQYNSKIKEQLHQLESDIKSIVVHKRR